ncbi:solute carrier family 43 member 3 isoform X1 [Cyanistes caeruleus]|uniref:solute carrier family 43 member 3 isoform X1 n=1 Tax=Cyanistes caeruleus TaxID=156563 RepID=UPI000CDB9B82|nr:solute carrier family 43 member 3 isoform X1 [Cyanistes caeruleus]
MMLVFPGVCCLCCHQSTHQDAQQCPQDCARSCQAGSGQQGQHGEGPGTVGGPSPPRGPEVLSGARGTIGDRQPGGPKCAPGRLGGESVGVWRCIPATLPGFKLHGGEGDGDSRRAWPRADCSGQDEQFSLVFTIGSFMNNFMTFPMGVVFDRFGTTAARLIAISLYTGGTLLVAFSTPEMAVLLFPAMSMLSVGGILLILTNMQVGNLFGNYRSIIITLYNGAFDSSSAIFLIVKLLYERGLSLRAMFLFLAACSAWHLLRTLFLMPRTRIPYPLPPDYDYGLQCRGRSRSYRAHKDKRPPGEAGAEETPLEPATARGGDTPGTPFRACACSWLFAWHVAWLSVMQLRHYLFIGTLNPQLEHLARGDHALVSTYTNAFAFTQLCGVLCAPWNGLILDRHKRGKGPRPEGNCPCTPRATEPPASCPEDN